MLAGCAAQDKKLAGTPLDPPAAVVFAPDAWIRGVTQEDIDYIKSALAQVRCLPGQVPRHFAGEGFGSRR